jgi:nitric oxide reductase NorD protein
VGLRTFLARRRAAALLRPEEAPHYGARLPEVSRRLELLIAALYGRAILITPAPPPKRLRRSERPVPANDGERIVLPAELQGDDAVSRYRLMALAQAERVARGTAVLAPGRKDALERDLYLLFESAAVDAAVAERVPGLRTALAAERQAERARRGELHPRGAAAREVETIVRELLAADVSAPPPSLAGCDTPHDSLRRARDAAARIRGAGRYRGVPPVDLWGSVLPSAVAAATPASGEQDLHAAQPQPQAGRLPRWLMGFMTTVGLDPRADAPEIRGHNPDTTSDAGTNPARAGTPQDDPSEGGAGDSQVSDTDSGERTDVVPERPTKTVFPYPEWDYAAGRYRTPGAIVRLHPSDEADGAWCVEALRRNAALARRVRQQFERLRARRVQIPRQNRGDELDLAACVAMLTDLRAGVGADDRLYTSVIPARRDVAITLLVDVSGSTSEVFGKHSILEVEKLALLLTGEALDGLGDPYSILTFSGSTARNVRIRQIKGFDERNGEAVLRRVDALRPEGYTRLGAAIRHATAQLRQQPAGHRLLLILSDGKPNDEDAYDGRYGVEDSRQAIAEARASGIHPFCLTVDLKGGDYLPRIFGPTGHVILHRVDLLPGALLGVIREIFRR